MKIEAWQEESRQCVRSLPQLKKYLPTLDIGRLSSVTGEMRFSITPHTLKLINFSDPKDPLLLMSVPQATEDLSYPEELADPIGDEDCSPLPFLIHRYPDRALICVTFNCAGYCRFCFRRYKTGQACPGPTAPEVDAIMRYINAHPGIEEVILSGGDPLTLLDFQIEDWLKHLRAIPHIRRIRLHTRTPVNLPSRITPSLIKIFKKYQKETLPIFIVTHFNHPREIAPENGAAILALVKAGLVVLNQHPLLKGVNDDVEVLRELYSKLINLRVLPYYLHQLDLAKGTGHFRVPLKKGMALMESLRGQISGYALPQYVIDLPHGQGKISLERAHLINQKDRLWQITSYTGKKFEYVEPEC